VVQDDDAHIYMNSIVATLLVAAMDITLVHSYNMLEPHSPRPL